MRDLAGRQSGQVEIVTVLRGLAATSVFLFHLVCVSNGYISDNYLRTFFGYGKFGVQFFFVISGFVIPYSMLRAGYELKDFFRFLLKRVVRIEPPYLLIVVLTVLFLLVRSRAEHHSGMPVTWQQVALHVGYLIPFSGYSWLSIVFWTLAIEFQFYLLFSLAFKLFTTGKAGRWLSSLLLLFLSWFIQWDNNFLYWSPIFLMGIYVALAKQKRIGHAELYTALGLLAVFALLKFGLVIDLFALTAVAAIWFEPVIRSAVLDFLGNISYSLYLSHTLIAFAVINLGIRYTRHPWQKPVFIAAAIAATMLFSYLLYYFVERPAKKWASSIKYIS